MSGKSRLEQYAEYIRDGGYGLPETAQEELLSYLHDAIVTEAAYIAATATPTINGNTSDGYHTFNELYHHRAVLFSVIVSKFPNLAWKARMHDDGTMFDGMFIVGIDTPDGPATYHYDIDPYWDMFQCKALDRAPAWDGHTPEQAIARIGSLAVTPPNLPLTREQVEALQNNDAVWIYQQQGALAWIHSAAYVQNYLLPCGNDIMFSRKPTPADIEAARKAGATNAR